LRTRGTVRILENPDHRKKDAELQSLQKQMEDCLSASDFERGLEIALGAIDRFPERPTLTHSWAIDFCLPLGRKRKAMKVLEQGFDRGAWWSPKILRSNLSELKDHQDFPRILKMGEDRFRKAEQIAEAKLIVRTPKEPSDGTRHPLLLVLHGAHSNNFDCEPHWLSILDSKRLFLASLQSSQVVMGDHYVWDDREIALREIENAYSMLTERYRIDTSKVVLGGISAGAETALFAVFLNRAPAKGFISVIPSVGAFIKEFVKNNSLPSIGTDLKGCIVAGEKDPRYGNVKIVYEFLSRKGVPIRLHSYSELGHSIPNDFDQVLVKSTEFILEE
jgi:hypothetical protein